MKKKTGRYAYKRTEIDGHSFHSTKEGNRYLVLKEQQANGQISNLQLQPPYRIEINGKLVCRYIADFSYEQNGQTIVEDVKSAHTAKDATYRLKKKLMLAVHGIEIQEVI